MAQRLDQVATLAEEHQPASVRNIYYRAVVAGIVPKTQSGYHQVQRALTTLRRDGRVPYRWIADNTRWMRRPTQYRDVEQALYVWAENYRRDMWTTTDVQVEVWCE